MTADLVKAAGGRMVPLSTADSHLDDIQIDVKPSIRQKKARSMVVTHALLVLTRIRH
jgi:hypothetical protein